MLQAVRSSGCTRFMAQNRSAWYFALLLSIYLLYLLIGAAIFSAVELPVENSLRLELLELKRDLLSEHQCISEEKLERFLKRVLDADEHGVSILHNGSANWNWDYMSSLFFVTTVLSTTGYGSTVPLSDGGKVFCIVYLIVGIPFTMLLLTALVQRIVMYVTRRPVLYIHLRWGYPKHIVAMIHAVLLGFLTFSSFFIIPASVFSILEEDWNFLESFYFCFISLSTIGLGDYVPGEGYNQRFRQFYKFGITCYLMLGLVGMLVMLETFCELQELKAFRKLFYVKKKKAEDEQNITEHDQLAFSSISEQADARLKGERKLSEPFVALTPVVNYDTSLNGEQ
ncbi:potassium channel subfamily K member 1 [Gastrophryne carolinensis]